MNQRQILTLTISALMILACADRAPEYPWIYDLNAEVDTQGRMTAYEFWATW